MSDLVAGAAGTSLAAIDALLAERALAMKQSIQVTSQNIALGKNGMFRMPNGEEIEVFDAVILDYKYRNQWYSKPYRKGEFSTADCFAVGDDASALVPHTEAPHPPATSCSSCPKNEFGSAPNGGLGKACQNQLLLAVMPADLTEGEEVYVLKASPTMLKNIAGHVVKLAELYGHPVKAVTRFTIDTTGDWPKLSAAFVGPNTTYVDHAKFLNDAQRALTAVPKKGGDVEANTNAATSASVRTRQ